MYIDIEVIPRLFCPAFLLSTVSYNATNTFGKRYLNLKYATQCKVTNSGGLMLTVIGD